MSSTLGINEVASQIDLDAQPFTTNTWSPNFPDEEKENQG